MIDSTLKLTFHPRHLYTPALKRWPQGIAYRVHTLHYHGVSNLAQFLSLQSDAPGLMLAMFVLVYNSPSIEVSMGCNYSQSSGTHTQPGSRQSWIQGFSAGLTFIACSHVLQLRDQHSLILPSRTSMCLTLPTVDTFTKD